MKNTNATTSDYPEIGGGVTICYWSDCSPATIIEISRTGHKITIQEDSWKRIDKNGISECQEYEYSADPKGTVHTASLRRDGTYRLSGCKTRVSLKGRRKFHDFSF